jgi:ankyrin repeat protein
MGTADCVPSWYGIVSYGIVSYRIFVELADENGRVNSERKKGHILYKNSEPVFITSVGYLQVFILFLQMASHQACFLFFFLKLIEEKLDEFLQQLSYQDSPNHNGMSPLAAAHQEDDTSYYYLLQELALITNEDGTHNHNHADAKQQAMEPPVCVSKESERLLWEASSLLSDSRPANDFLVYDRQGATTLAPPQQQQDYDQNIQNNNNNLPPIYDGSVANSTPPPLGGAAAGASGGAGTILHVACAMDLPLVLAFLLCMGADARASHTAFRRLMIHEAACNGSINCLRLLLEMGNKYANETEKREAPIPFFPDAFGDRGTTFSLTESASTSASASASSARSQLPMALSSVKHYRRGGASRGVKNHMDYLSLLRQFKNCYLSVQQGQVTELEAARNLLKNAWLLDTSRTSLIRSCAFKTESLMPRTFLRPHGCADGHGNTPLHWAAFKNEVECVSLLLKFDADADARAHPSGWTPLHDAAYSNSSDSIALLIYEGAQVDARANSGATPLCFAAQEDAADAAQLLLDRGADLSARCAGGPANRDDHISHLNPQPMAPNHPHSRFSGYTPLHYCAHYNAHSAAKILLKHSTARMAMETPDLSERLPIHVAVARGSSDVLRELLHAGARVDIRPGFNNSSSPRSIIAASLPPQFLTLAARLPDTPVRRPPSPERPPTPPQLSSRTSPGTPVSSPILRSMIPLQPITSSKPWNCLTQQAIDECRDLISKAEQSWSPLHHLLFTPQDRRAVMELLRVGKRLEQQGSGIFIDLWPLVLGFCGRGWFEPEGSCSPMSIDDEPTSSTSTSPSPSQGHYDQGTGTGRGGSDDSDSDSEEDEDDHYLDLPVLS